MDSIQHDLRPETGKVQRRNELGRYAVDQDLTEIFRVCH